MSPDDERRMPYSVELAAPNGSEVNRMNTGDNEPHLGAPPQGRRPAVAGEMEGKRILDEFLALVHVDSPPRKEGRIMRILASQLQAIGFKVVFDNAHAAVGGEVGNLIATLRASRPGVPSLFLSAHVDTVTSTAGIQTIVEDGVVRTDGTTILGADDKAAVVAILEAVRHIVAFEIPHGEIQVLFSICEEIGLKGAAAMDFSQVTAKMGFVFDSGQPVSGIVVHSPSHDRIHAVVHGRKAHAGAAPENGISAIQAAAAGIAKMKLGRIDSETTANVGVISGGEATNIIPDKVNIQAEARSRSEGKLQAQVAHMIECIQQGAAEYGAEADVDVARHYSSFKLSEADAVVRVASEAMAATGRQPCLLAGGGGSDANIFNANGLPSVVLGVGYQNIHSNDECIAVADLVAAYRTAVALIERAAEGAERI